MVMVIYFLFQIYIQTPGNINSDDTWEGGQEPDHVEQGHLGGRGHDQGGYLHFSEVPFFSFEENSHEKETTLILNNIINIYI